MFGGWRRIIPYFSPFIDNSIASQNSIAIYHDKFCITQRTNAFTAEISDGEDKEVEKLFSKYDYDYEFISTEDLDKAIEENKEFYYLRYARANAERFVQVVNSKTGEVIFREYITGLGYNLKAKNLGYLSDVIAKSAKKLAK